MFKVHGVLLVFSLVRVKHFDLRYFEKSAKKLQMKSQDWKNIVFSKLL